MPERSKQITRTLQFFYANPIATVSLELFLTIFLILFLAIFAIRPTLLTMSDLLKEIDDKTTLNEKLTQKVAALSTAQTEFLTYEPRLDVLDQAIPQSPEIMNALKIIEKTASEQRVIISSLSVSSVPDENLDVPFAQKQLTQVPISMSLSGDYLSIRSFIELLKQNRRAFILDTIIFNAENNGGNRVLDTTITLNIAFFEKK